MKQTKFLMACMTSHMMPSFHKVKVALFIFCFSCIGINSYGQWMIDNVGYNPAKSGDYAVVVAVSPNITSVTLRQTVWLSWVNKRLPVFYINNNSFSRHAHIKSVNILSPLIGIESNAFYYFTVLDSVYLPPPGVYDSKYFLQYIGENAFQDCWKLRYINLPVKLNDIRRSAFLDCWSLAKIDIPYTVENIGETAFKNCRSLKSIVLSTSVSNMGQAVFQNCTALETVGFYNKTMLSIKPLTFDNCTSLREVDIAYNTILYIDSAAFRNCSSLPKITLPASIDERSIGVSAFEGCTALDSVTALMEEPHPFGQDAFKDISPTCVLTVPYGKKAAYIAAGWTEEVFRGGVRELPPPAGIRHVMVNAADAACYDLQGRPVEHPQKGRIYIRQGRKIVCP